MENNRFREKKILIYKQYVDYFKTKRNPKSRRRNGRVKEKGNGNIGKHFWIF